MAQNMKGRKRYHFAWQKVKHDIGCDLRAVKKHILRYPDGMAAAKSAKLAGKNRHAREMLIQWLGARKAHELIAENNIALPYYPGKDRHQRSVREHLVRWAHFVVYRRNRPEDFTKGGLPKVAVIKELTGIKPTAEERTAALEGLA